MRVVQVLQDIELVLKASDVALAHPGLFKDLNRPFCEGALVATLAHLSIPAFSHTLPKLVVVGERMLHESDGVCLEQQVWLRILDGVILLIFFDNVIVRFL